MLLLITTDWTTIQSVLLAGIPYVRVSTTADAAVFLACDNAGRRDSWLVGYGRDVIADPEQYPVVNVTAAVGLVAHVPGQLDRSLWAGSMRLDLERTVALPDGIPWLREELARRDVPADVAA